MLVAKKMKIEEIKRLKREQEELAKLQKRQDIYLNNKGKFFGICFSDGPLRIKVLESVEEFYNLFGHYFPCIVFHFSYGGRHHFRFFLQQSHGHFLCFFILPRFVI